MKNRNSPRDLTATLNCKKPTQKHPTISYVNTNQEVIDHKSCTKRKVRKTAAGLTCESVTGKVADISSSILNATELHKLGSTNHFLIRKTPNKTTTEGCTITNGLTTNKCHNSEQFFRLNQNAYKVVVERSSKEIELIAPRPSIFDHFVTKHACAMYTI